MFRNVVRIMAIALATASVATGVSAQTDFEARSRYGKTGYALALYNYDVQTGNIANSGNVGQNFWKSALDHVFNLSYDVNTGWMNFSVTNPNAVTTSVAYQYASGGLGWNDLQIAVQGASGTTNAATLLFKDITLTQAGVINLSNMFSADDAMVYQTAGIDNSQSWVLSGNLLPTITGNPSQERMRVMVTGINPIPEPAFFQMGALAAMSGLGLLRLRKRS